jgi:hypothetical protein
MSLLSAYQDLITSEHRGKPRYMATVTALLQYSNDIFELAVYMDDFFDLDEAEGAQEDVLGQIVGASRVLPYQPAKGLSPVLDDAAYRNLIKAKIAKNLWKGGAEDLAATWRTIFGDGIIIQDNGDMTIDVLVIGINDQITQEMVLKGLIVPKPQSVGVKYQFSPTAVFGYDMENDFIRGYDHANWAYGNPLPSFSYDTEDEENGMLGYDEGYWN